MPNIQRLRIRRFNTWAREEPNFRSCCIRRGFRRFNTWAREEPNDYYWPELAHLGVSILGLARSPTGIKNARNFIQKRFNTWAREEPNSPFAMLFGHYIGFNTWAREEPNKILALSVKVSPGFNTWAREEPN